MIAATTVAASVASGPAQAQQMRHGSVAEVRAMLDRVVAVRAGDTGALEGSNAGTNGSRGTPMIQARRPPVAEDATGYVVAPVVSSPSLSGRVRAVLASPRGPA